MTLQYDALCTILSDTLLNHQTNHLSAFQLNEKQNKILRNIIVIAGHVCCLCNVVFDVVIAWS